VRGLQYVALLALTSVFLYRFGILVLRGDTKRRLVEREFLVPWLACGIGSLAMLTQGEIWSQRALDAPLGGTNILKLVQDVLTVTAFALGAWTALDLDEQRPTRRRTRRGILLVIFVAALVLTFFLTGDRGPTNYFYVEQNQGRPTVWIFAVTYILELAGVTGILLIGVWRRKAWPYWLFRIGGILVLVACLLELIDLVATFAPGLEAIRGGGRALFDPTFYPGVALIVAALGVFAAVKWCREHRISHYVDRLGTLCQKHALPTVTGAGRFGSLAQLTITVRDSYLAGSTPLTESDLKLLHDAEQFIEFELSHLIDLGETPTIIIEPERTQ
jgi:hypothetical protein